MGDVQQPPCRSFGVIPVGGVVPMLFGGIETDGLVGEIETDGFTGEIPNTVCGPVEYPAGVSHTPLVGDVHTGPVRGFGDMNTPGAFGDSHIPPARLFGEMGGGPVRAFGIIDSPGCAGPPESGGYVGTVETGP